MKELEEIQSKLVLSLSENLNLRNKIKEQDKEKHDLMNDFFSSIIKTIDMFESKEENFLERFKGKNADAEKIINSYSLIKKQMLNILKNHGVTQLEFPENRLIIGFSKVIDTEPDPNKKNDTIISILKNGYIRGKELIREAELIVVKN